MATALDQNFSSLASILMQRRQMQMQEAENAKQNQLRDLQIKQVQSGIEDQNAKSGALRKLYGAGSNDEAYLKQMQQEKDAKETAQIFDQIKTLKQTNASPQAITEWAKQTLSSNPKYAGLAPHISFLDDTAIEITKPFKDGELRDPTNPNQFLPAGTYKVKGKATGDMSNPYAFTGIEPITAKTEYKDRTRPEGTGTVFEQSTDGGKTWKVVSRGIKGSGGGAGGAKGGEPKPGKALPAGTLTDLNEASQMIKTLKEAQGLAAGVNTGPITGRLQSIGQKFGVASGDFTQMKQKIATVNNAMLKLRSGAAVTESEYQRFLQEMPTANDTEAVRDAKFANATKYMEDLLDGKIATFAEGGYKVPTGVSERSQPSAGKTSQPSKKSDKRPPLSAIFGTKR